AGPIRVELALGPEIVFQGSGPGWIPDPDDAQSERSGPADVLTFSAGTSRRGRPFAFKMMALEPVPLPPLVAPRLLIKTIQGFEETIRSRARYWVETHGPVFPF